MQQNLRNLHQLTYGKRIWSQTTFPEKDFIGISNLVKGAAFESLILCKAQLLSAWFEKLIYY